MVSKGKSRRRRESNLKEVKNDQRLPPPPKASKEGQALPAGLRRMMALRDSMKGTCRFMQYELPTSNCINDLFSHAMLLVVCNAVSFPISIELCLNLASVLLFKQLLLQNMHRGPLI